MRWEMLFADLEAQLEAARALDVHAVAADLTRAEAATIPLTDRLRGLRGTPVRAALVNGQDMEGEVREVFPEWVLLAAAGREVILPLRAVESWTGLGPDTAPPTASEVGTWLRPPREGPPRDGPPRGAADAAETAGGSAAAGPRPVPSMLGLGQALRRLSRDRAVVVVQTASREHHGRIDRVGRDHLDLQPDQGQDWGARRRASDRRIVIGTASIVLIGSSAR
ncbi:hypothetical protein SAMN05216410_3525 [Sanguibacter gelidistatuariae]|uniref:Uncharacterized protein n=1 Tax=Sanguibacter gelidistatuariae TaxID=1814289 RepID=A0A1G6VS69_9MICO|nr:hypothetical protein [Sanguibacter gelidistatuariae]SDD56530.1 hypothetical protein SAMN05216410_3525 [Sanguibacter gelidistatuariae]